MNSQLAWSISLTARRCLLSTLGCAPAGLIIPTLENLGCGRRFTPAGIKRRRAGTSLGSCPWCERDSFSRAQRLSECLALSRVELGLNERHCLVLVINDKPGSVSAAVDPEHPNIAARELDGSDSCLHWAVHMRRSIFAASSCMALASRRLLAVLTAGQTVGVEARDDVGRLFSRQILDLNAACRFDLPADGDGI